MSQSVDIAVSWSARTGAYRYQIGAHTLWLSATAHAGAYTLVPRSLEDAGWEAAHIQAFRDVWQLSGKLSAAGRFLCA